MAVVCVCGGGGEGGRGGNLKRKQTGTKRDFVVVE